MINAKMLNHGMRSYGWTDMTFLKLSKLKCESGNEPLTVCSLRAITNCFGQFIVIIRKAKYYIKIVENLFQIKAWRTMVMAQQRQL